MVRFEPTRKVDPVVVESYIRRPEAITSIIDATYSNNTVIIQSSAWICAGFQIAYSTSESEHSPSGLKRVFSWQPAILRDK